MPRHAGGKWPLQPNSQPQSCGRTIGKERSCVHRTDRWISHGINYRNHIRCRDRYPPRPFEKFTNTAHGVDDPRVSESLKWMEYKHREVAIWAKITAFKDIGWYEKVPLPDKKPITHTNVLLYKTWEPHRMVLKYKVRLGINDNEEEEYQ